MIRDTHACERPYRRAASAWVSPWTVTAVMTSLAFNTPLRTRVSRTTPELPGPRRFRGVLLVGATVARRIPRGARQALAPVYRRSTRRHQRLAPATARSATTG